MGNICPGAPKSNGRLEDWEKDDESQHQQIPDDIWTKDVLNSQLDELMKAMQIHNLKRMREEIETDMNTFILNNILMCIQFFENFERAKEDAGHIKREKEFRLNDQLAQDPIEGMILGERRCHLLHGMGYILAQNYIYRSPENIGEEEYYGNYYYGSDPKNTFMCEGILPLEFLMTWENFELYQNSEWELLQALTYSSAKGSPPILRFCMEEPNAKNKVPRGYLRLRSVDVTAEVHKPLETESSGYDHTYAGKYSDADKVSEAPTESGDDLSDDSCIDDRDFKNKIMTSRNYLHTMPSSLSYSNPSSMERPTPNKAIETKADLAKKRLREKLEDRRPSGVMPINYPVGKPLMKSNLSLPLNITESPIIPTVQVNKAITPPVTNNLPPSFNPNESSTGAANYLSPPSMRQRLKGQFSGPNGNSSSSGYETMDSGALSRSSSVASEEIRYKWRQVELKQLSQYPSKSRVRPEIEIEHQDPLSPNCFIPMKLELSSDEDDSGSESDDSYESSESGKPNKEPQFDTLFYLNSTQFSSEFCSEFHAIGVKGGIPARAVNQAVVLGTTIRCPVEYDAEHEYDSFHIAQTFTPAIHSKSWPSNYYFWFNQRMLNRNRNVELNDQWPSQDQVEMIEKLGSNAIPIGFRSLQFFNAQQSLEWQTNFFEAETILLNSFKSVHWRAYIFSSTLYRAFLAPLGPQGLGVEHIRNILYFMCHEDFVGWNDEQSGVHVRAVINKLFDCLGKGKMPNFFIQSQDLLKNIPQQNARLVQAHLSKLRDNLVVYCIYALRNLTCLRPTERFYPTPNLKKLYSIITVPNEKDLLQINNPALGSSGNMQMEEEITPNKKLAKKKKDKYRLNLIENEDIIEADFRTMISRPAVDHHDKIQTKLRKKRIEYDRKMREIAREQKNKNLSADEKIPASERRKSIDLQQLPIVQERFSQLRKVLVIEFFIRHFLKMAFRSNEFRNYSQSAMYIMQVENLCEILSNGGYDLGKTSLDLETVEDYKKQCQELRELVGNDMREYVTSRFSHLNIPTLSNQHTAVYGDWTRRRVFHNNWDFRKLPTPPGSNMDPEEFEKLQTKTTTLTVTMKKLETPDIAKTLQSIKPVVDRSPIPSATSSAKLARRAESFKFVDTPIAMKKSPSRQSIILADMEFETTDL